VVVLVAILLLTLILMLLCASWGEVWLEGMKLHSLDMSFPLHWSLHW
jgi:hypothetical protein